MTGTKTNQITWINEWTVVGSIHRSLVRFRQDTGWDYKRSNLSLHSSFCHHIHVAWHVVQNFRFWCQKPTKRSSCSRMLLTTFLQRAPKGAQLIGWKDLGRWWCFNSDLHVFGLQLGRLCFHTLEELHQFLLGHEARCPFSGGPEFKCSVHTCLNQPDGRQKAPGFVLSQPNCSCVNLAQLP